MSRKANVGGEVLEEARGKREPPKRFRGQPRAIGGDGPVIEAVHRALQAAQTTEDDCIWPEICAQGGIVG
jgi:hypothetical protein